MFYNAHLPFYSQADCWRSSCVNLAIICWGQLTTNAFLELNFAKIYLGCHTNKVLCRTNLIIGVLKRCDCSISADVMQDQILQCIYRAMSKLYTVCQCGVIYPKRQQTTWNIAYLEYLRCIKHDPNASIKKSTFTELGTHACEHLLPRSTLLRLCVQRTSAKEYSRISFVLITVQRQHLRLALAVTALTNYEVS